MSARTLQSWCSLGHEKTLSVLGGSFAFLFVLSLFLPFDSLWTYLFGFLAATIAACAMILSARILHEKTPDKRNQPSSISWQIPVMVSTFSTEPFFIIFSQHLGNMMAALVTTIVSLDSNGSVLLYFGANHCRQGASGLWYEDGSQFLTKPIFYLMIPLALLMIGDLCLCTNRRSF